MTTPATPDSGLIGPLMKAYAHAFYINFADAYGAAPADDTVIAELWAGIDHLNDILATTPMLTTFAENAKEITIQALRTAANDPNKKESIKTAIRSLASFGLVMDKELLGLTDATLNPDGA